MRAGETPPLPPSAQHNSTFMELSRSKWKTSKTHPNHRYTENKQHTPEPLGHIHTCWTDKTFTQSRDRLKYTAGSPLTANRLLCNDRNNSTGCNTELQMSYMLLMQNAKTKRVLTISSTWLNVVFGVV